MEDSRGKTICAMCKFVVNPPTHGDIHRCSFHLSRREGLVDDVTGDVAYTIKRGGGRVGISKDEFPPCSDVKDNYRNHDGTCRWYEAGE